MIYIYIQWVLKVFRPPYIFHSLLYCSHLLKSFKFIFFLINVHTAPHIDRKTQNCWNFCRFIKKEKLKYHLVLSIQTLCCDTPFLLIILEMVLHLHFSPAVFDYTDWTWLGKPHTCLYKTLQLTVHVRANENHEVKETAWRAQRQNCGKAQIWPRLQKKICCT